MAQPSNSLAANREGTAMNSNITVRDNAIVTCERTALHGHSDFELQQLQIARIRAGRRSRQVFSCPMIRSWRRNFDATYNVRTAPALSGAPRTEEEEALLRDCRALEADVQVGNVLLRWHFDSWPVAMLRTIEKTDLDGDAPALPPVPAPIDPNCGGFAHRASKAQLLPARDDDFEGCDKHSSDVVAAVQKTAEERFVAAFAPTVLTRPRPAGRRVAFDATLLRTAPTLSTGQQANYDAGFYVKNPSPIRRQSGKEIEYAVLTHAKPASKANGADSAF